MLISHESPIDLLNDSLAYNDYDYCLVHLLDTHPEYYSFFCRSLAAGREVLLDNSIFELKTAFDAEAYAKHIKQLQPTFYIVPDALNDSVRTRTQFVHFVKSYPNLPGLRIGAVQGKTWREIVDCYKFMADEADYIAISFDSDWYDYVGYTTIINTSDRQRQLQSWCSGRQHLIQRLVDEGIWCNKPHHLLGCSLASEFKYYRENKIPNIRSVDTSNPVVAGINHQRYIKGIGLLDKSSQLLAELIDYKPTPEQKKDIFDNIIEFRNIVTGQYYIR